MRRNELALLTAVTAVILLASAGCGGPTAPRAAETPGEEGVISLDYPRWETMEPGEQQAYNRRANTIQRGREVYYKYCSGCHGDQGRGEGPAAERLITQPRDFTSGIYKFRSTDSGSLPMEADLYRTITRGLSGVSMPAFPLMAHRDKVSVIEYVKSFYPRWEEEAGRRTMVPVPRAPSDLIEARRIQRGRVVYLAMQCSQCHGVDGAGTRATRTEYVDAWGNPQKPHNFTRGSLKGGELPEDIYRTFHTGLRSIMPSYGGDTLMAVVRDGFPPGEGLLEPGELEELSRALGDFPASMDEISAMSRERQQQLAERNSWDLVAYILSLRQTTTTAAAVLGASYGEGSYE